MSDPKILIYGSSYITNHTERDLLVLWAKTLRAVNPGIQILLIDSASPIKPESIFPFDPSQGLMIYQFGENVGHQARGGLDGAGRAVCKGIEIAIEDGYDYAVYIEGDLLFARPIMPIIEKMRRHSVKFATVFDTMYRFVEGGLMFMDVAYMAETKFVERYDWATRRDQMPEWRHEDLIGDDMWLLPLRGLRNDYHMLTVGNIKATFPRGISYITHCRHFDLYHRFLEMNGIKI